MYPVVHQTSGAFYWNVTEFSLLERNDFPMGSMMIGGIPPVYNRNKLKSPGTNNVLRPQENSLHEVQNLVGVYYSLSLRNYDVRGYCIMHSYIFESIGPRSPDDGG